MPRISATVTDDQATVLADEADEARVTQAAVLRAALQAIHDDARVRSAVRRRITPTKWGGNRRGGPRQAKSAD